jgi:ankyrin repeat protein
MTPLIIASLKGHLKIVKLLIVSGANVNAGNITNTTPIMYSSVGGWTDIIKFLIVSGANVNAVNNNGVTALMYSSAKGFLDIVELLVSKGADINAIDDRGNTAMLLAYTGGHTQVIRFLNKVMNKGYLQDFKRVARTVRPILNSRQSQLRRYTPLPNDLTRKIAVMSINSFGKKKLSSLKHDLNFLKKLTTK